MNLNEAKKILKNNGYKLMEDKGETEIDELFNDIISDYEYYIPWDDGTYKILDSVKRKYKNIIKPNCEKIKNKEKRWKSKCKSYIEDFIAEIAMKKAMKHNIFKDCFI